MGSRGSAARLRAASTGRSVWASPRRVPCGSGSLVPSTWSTARRRPGARKEPEGSSCAWRGSSRGQTASPLRPTSAGSSRPRAAGRWARCSSTATTAPSAWRPAS